ncbi:MAG: serine hydrolase domain-containing protein, partial [Mycobacterium sp.]
MGERQRVKPDQRRLDVLVDRCRLEVENGALPSAQIALHVDGEEYVSETFGAATPSTRYVLQSTGRSIVAGILWKLISDGLLDTSRTVASYIPEFGTNGKDSVTV